MACKFVINDGKIKFGNVQSHFQICEDNKKTIGGGYWHWDRRANILYLYSESGDYGACTAQQVKDAWNNTETFLYNWRKQSGTQVIFSPHPTLDIVFHFPDDQVKIQ